MQPVESPLVATKLFVPRLRPNRVDRSRLRERLDRSRHVVLVSAPAGSGKSTLLADWSIASGERIAWVSLENADDDPRTLLNYIFAALRHAEAISRSETVDPVRAASPEIMQNIVAGMLNDVASGTGAVTLVLDDFHVIQSQKAHEVIQFMLDHLPPNLRMVLSTRSDPPLALSRLRARDLLTEVRAAELRFSRDEAAQFLNESMDLQLGDVEVAELERRTEGWAVGLQMAAISLRGRGAPQTFIAGFTGSNRYILDYLTDEVLAGQANDVRQFLLETSILDRLSAPLCNAVTGREDSERILQLLDASNLFLIALDEVRYWYRYHHLFGTLLQHQLQRSVNAGGVAQLHQRASDWYVANGSPEAGMQHAIAAGDLDRARSIVARHAFPRLLRGDSATVRRWLDALPKEEVENRIELLIFRAITGILEFRLDIADENISRAEKLANDDTPPHLRAGMLTVRGTLLRNQQRMEDAIESFERALQIVEPGAPWYSIIAFELGMTAIMKTSLVRAEEVFVYPRSEYKRPEHILSALLGQSMTAFSRILRGYPDDAVALANEALVWVEEWDAQFQSGKALAAYPYAILAEVHRLWNDLPAARSFAERGVEQAKRGFFIGNFESSRVLMAVAEDQNDWETAIRLQGEMARSVAATGTLVHRLTMEWLLHRILIRRAQRTGSARDLDSAAAALDKAGLLHPPFRIETRRLPGFFAFEAVMVNVRVLMMQNRAPEALQLLDSVVKFAKERDCGAIVIEALILRALVENSITTMQEALDLAAGPRYVRLFVNEGSGAVTLIERAAPRVKDRDFAMRVLSGFDVKKTAGGVLLSDREVEVLHLIASGASNQDAARKLFISPATVKKHLENIYTKLGVGGRIEAIARAREMNLLQ